MSHKDMTYEQALHAMQSGVAMEMNYHSAPTAPKHLRVGVNSAMVTDRAIARLLIDKGIITKEEYCEAVRQSMVMEVVDYEERLSGLMGREITLG